MKALVCVLAMSFAFTAGCASTWRQRQASLTDEARVQEWQSGRLAGNSRANIDDIRSFVEKNKSSRFWQAARLELSLALIEAGDGAEAEGILKSVRDQSLGREEKIVAMAEWALSQTTEQRGDDLRSLAHLLGAERMAGSLPSEISRVELPVRKALLLQKMGRPSDAERSFRDAEKGLQDLMANPSFKYDPAWMARMSYQMGYALSGPVTEENFFGLLRAQSFSQVYLLRALAMNQGIWSERAAEALRQSYGGFWSGIVNAQAPSGLEPLVADRQRRQKQVMRGTALLEVLEKAQAYSPPRSDSASSLQKDFYAWVQELRDKVRTILYSNVETTILTEESQRLNGIRRPGRIVEDVTPPAESSDPNL